MLKFLLSPKNSYRFYIIRNFINTNYIRFADAILKFNPNLFKFLRNIKRILFGISQNKLERHNPFEFLNFKIQERKKLKSRLNEKDKLNITHFIGSLSSGGAERQLTYLCIKQKEMGYNVSVLIYYNQCHPPYLDILKKNNIKVLVAKENVNLKNFLKSKAYYINWKIVPYYMVNYVSDIVPNLFDLKPDVLHCWLDHSNIWGSISGIFLNIPKIILSTRNVNPSNFNHLNIIGVKEIYKKLENVNGIIFYNNSKYGATDYSKWIGVNKKIFSVVYNGIDKNKFMDLDVTQQKYFNKKFQIENSKKIILGILRLSPEKRPFDFLETIKLLSEKRKDFVSVIYGEGFLRNEMINFIKKHKLNKFIKLAGVSNNVNIALASADVLLMTSEFEGTPNVLIEAQILKCPIVSTNAGGILETVLNNDTAYCVNVGNVEDLTNNLNFVLNKGKTKFYKEKSIKIIEKKFDLNKMVRNTNKLYFK